MSYIEKPIYPDRRRGIYSEIKNWKSYELRNNIAYEMAIRNKKNRFFLKKYKRLIKLLSFEKEKFTSSKINENNIAFLEATLKENQEILLVFNKYKKDFYYKLLYKKYPEKISSKIYSLLDQLLWNGFTIEAIDFHTSMSLLSEIEKFKSFTHKAIYNKIMDKTFKYHYLHKYFICILGNKQLYRSIPCQYIEDENDKLYYVILEEDGSWAYTKNDDNVLEKYSQINPSMGFKNEVLQSYQLLKSRPLMMRPYRHKNILLNVNVNQNPKALKEEVETILSLLNKEREKEDKRIKKYNTKRTKEINRYKRMTKKGLATLKLAYDFFHSKNSTTTTEDLHHVVEHNIDRPEGSRTLDDPQYFSDGLYLFDCDEKWQSYRKRAEHKLTKEELAQEEISFEDFIYDKHVKLFKNHPNKKTDYKALSYLRDFQRYIDGVSYDESKKYQKESIEYFKKRQEIYEMNINESNVAELDIPKSVIDKMDIKEIEEEVKRRKLQKLTAPQEIDPNYFSLI
jgi:hypothetical protein